MRYLLSKFTSARYVARHRGTRVQLIEQEAAYRLRAHAMFMEQRRAQMAEVA